MEDWEARRVFEDFIELCTPLEVANKLRKEEIKGQRRQAGNCPIANYLRIKGLTDIAVGGRVAHFRSEPLRNHHVPVPAVVDLFIYGFDSGGYEDLCE